MDLSSLKETVSNLTLYDLKAGVRKVQNAVMNYTEMEAKVREATNNEPWGASSTLMQDIANGTFNYQQLNEIMPMIYKRFTEKSAEEWRQIYKALQLLEFLIRHGSERVIDDARSHLSLLKMLRQFHFIDQNGKDQGINVRNRSKELVELLSDVEKIRGERKKARATRNKYGGYEGGGMGMGGGMGESSKYGGFGSESAGYGGYSGGVYGDGGGFGGQASDYQDTQNRRERFEEYDEYDEESAVPSSRRNDPSSPPRPTKKTEPPKPKEPDVDLFSFDDPASAPSTSNGKAAATTSSNDFGALQSSAGDDDDFDDFQSADPTTSSIAASQPAATSFSIPPPASTSTTTSATQFAAPQPRSGAQGQNISDLFASISPPPRTNTAPSTFNAVSAPPAPTSTTSSAFKPPQPTGYQPNQPNYFQSVQAIPSQMQSRSGTSTPVSTSMATLGKPVSNTLSGGAAAKKSAGGDAFADLLGGSSKAAKKSAAQTKGVSLADMQRQKASAGIWGGGSALPAQQQQQQAMGGTRQKLGGGLEDLLG